MGIKSNPIVQKPITRKVVETNKETMRALFAKYLAGKCSPQEERQVLDYFTRAEDENNIRALIRAEFEKEVPINKVNMDTVAELHRNFAGVLGERGTRRVWLLRPQLAATWLILLMSLGVLLFLYWTRSGLAEVSEINTRPGERKRIELTDGSVVWLNAASTLRYPDKFNADTREVTLEGEAFFEITTDPEHPFIIHSGELQTTVLGTSFNIRAYEEDKTLSVAVVTGKVKVATAETQTELQLVPDQQAVFDKNERRLNKQEQVFATGLASWKDGLFQFRNTTFSEVTAILQRSYNVQISYAPHLENCPIIHADFTRNEPIDKILKTLLSSVNGKVDQTREGHYYLTSAVACQPQTLVP